MHQSQQSSCELQKLAAVAKKVTEAGMGPRGCRLKVLLRCWEVKHATSLNELVELEFALAGSRWLRRKDNKNAKSVSLTLTGGVLFLVAGCIWTEKMLREKMK